MRRGVNPTMMDRSNRHSQTLTSAKALEAAKVIRRKCSNVSSRPGRQRFFHTQAGYMYATTFLLTGSTLLKPGEGPYMHLHPWHRKRGSPAACPHGRISGWWQWDTRWGFPPTRRPRPPSLSCSDARSQPSDHVSSPMSWSQQLKDIVGMCISSWDSPPESSLHLIRRLATR